MYYYPPPPLLVSLRNGKRCNPGILQHSETLNYRHLCHIGIHNQPQSADIEQNSDEGISDFRFSAQSLKNENSRTSNYIDIKLGPVTKLDNRNTATSKNLNDDVVSANCFRTSIAMGK